MDESGVVDRAGRAEGVNEWRVGVCGTEALLTGIAPMPRLFEGGRTGVGRIGNGGGGICRREGGRAGTANGSWLVRWPKCGDVSELFSDGGPEPKRKGLSSQ